MAAIPTLANPSATTDVNYNPLAGMALAQQYGPQTLSAIRRSQYLADALKQLTTQGAENIRSPGELGAKLLATALLQRGNEKGQDALNQALLGEQNDESTRLLGALKGSQDAPAQMGPPQPQTAQVQAPQDQAAPVPPPQPVTQADLPPPAPQAQAPQYSPADVDAATRMAVTEAGGEGPTGMAAVVHVAKNRLASGYGGATSLSDVIHAPHQFTGMSKAAGVTPDDYARARPIVEAVLSGQAPDPTGGALHFLNPELTVQQGYPVPSWAKDPGVRIGQHVFHDQQPQQGAQQTAAPNQIQASPSQGAAPLAAPGGTAPAGALPQAGPAGASPSAAQGPGSVPAPAGALAAWPKWQPEQSDIAYVQSLLNTPRYHQDGVMEALKMRQRMTQPVEAQVTTINGVPFYVPKDPRFQGAAQPIPVPNAAMTHTQTAQQAGIAAPAGTTYDVDPLGNHKQIAQPAAGYQTANAPGQPYRERSIPGGQADPMRPQAPAPGYQYAGPQSNPYAAQQVIPGSAQDPHSPMNVAQATQQIQTALRPTIDLARDARQSVDMVSAGHALQNGSGDVAMLKGLNQLVNRGVVRPTDMEAQLKSDGLAGGLGELMGYVNSTGVLPAEAREKVMAAAQAIYKSADQGYRSQVLAHRSTVDAVYGQGAFDRYVFPPEEAQALGWTPQAPQGQGAMPQPQPSTQPLPAGTRDAALAEARRRGLIH